MPNTCKMNVVKRNYSAAPECTACGHRFETEYADNPYREMCRIALGKFKFCPQCGAKYTGCQIEGIDIDKADPDLRNWIERGL